MSKSRKRSTTHDQGDNHTVSISMPTALYRKVGPRIAEIQKQTSIQLKISAYIRMLVAKDLESAEKEERAAA